ncbi:hypothetical protein [uncultured Chitinophaga sp.]|uniref:hypothetical protein n=1 Tax=uncultured Chitinophaga sp. TaxID=339340 RepID=UPI00262B7B7F|nr:hypothetical protein [uncultured Chitinophaga sp.]
MKKAKSLLIVAGFTLAIIPALAYVDDPLCSVSALGYTQSINDPAFIIPGAYDTRYECIYRETEVCRYVKKQDGTFIACKGRLIIPDK